MADKQVTYYIGAGASIGAIPAYASFTNHFITFLKNLIQLVENYNDEDYRKRKVSALITDLLVEIVAEPGLTLDVFGRRLYRRNQKSLDYHFFKVLLNLYILSEQLSFTDELAAHELVHNKTNIDARYEHFLSQAIGESGTISSNINFISWNYDSQFELAYSRIYKTTFQDSQSYLQIFPSASGFTIPDGSCVLKLNGSTNLYLDERKRNMFKIFDLYNEKFNGSTIGAFYQVLVQNSEQVKTDFYLFFAWESGNEFEKKILTRAKSILEHTEELIVIGYSFPEYNRSIDKEILSNAKKLKKIYIQVLPKDFAGIQSRLRFISDDIHLKSELWEHTDTFLYTL